MTVPGVSPRPAGPVRGPPGRAVATFSIGTTTVSGLLTVRLEGQIDSEAMPQLRGALALVGRTRPPVLSFDFTSASFIGLSAMGALLVARATALQALVGVITPGAPRAFYRLMDATDRVGLLVPPPHPPPTAQSPRERGARCN